MPEDAPPKEAAKALDFRWLAAIFALGFAVFWPSIRAPFWLDDYAHVSMTEGTFPAPRGPLDLYDFVSDGDRSVLIARGILPWWTDPTLKLRFFRPLSSAMLWVEHRAFGHHAIAMHLSSMAWWAAAVFAVFALYKRLFGARVARMATLFFALAPCHAMPIAWIANREVLVSIVFGALGLGAHIRFREGRGVRHALVATACFLLSMAAGEYGIGFAGYLFAFELTRRDGALRRALSLGTFAIPAGAYLAVRAALHYGTAGSGFYHDPLREPLRFLEAAPRRFATLLIDAWLTLDADMWGADAKAGWLIATVIACALTLGTALSHALAARAADERRSAVWLIAGSMIALVPVLAVSASMRLLGEAMIGVAPAIALLVDHAWFGEATATPSKRTEWTRVVATGAAFLHFAHAPMGAWMAAREFHRSAVEFSERAAWLREHVQSAAGEHVVVARSGWQSVLFGSFAFDPHGTPPATWRVLALTHHALLTRKDARTVEVMVPHGSRFFPTGPNDLFRSADRPLRTGDVVDVPGMRAEVVADGLEGAARVRFSFDEDLDAPSARWITELALSYADAPPPARGFGKKLDP